MMESTSRRPVIGAAGCPRGSSSEARSSCFPAHLLSIPGNHTDGSLPELTLAEHPQPLPKTRTTQTSSDSSTPQKFKSQAFRRPIGSGPEPKMGVSKVEDFLPWLSQSFCFLVSPLTPHPPQKTETHFKAFSLWQPTPQTQAKKNKNLRQGELPSRSRQPIGKTNSNHGPLRTSLGLRLLGVHALPIGHELQAQEVRAQLP